MKQHGNLPNRQSTRLKEYDYSGLGVYFLTLCVEGRVPLFGTILNGEMILNTFGRIVAEEWEKSADIRDNISVGEFIVMPDHFHGIIQITKKIEGTSKPGEFISPSHNIGALIRGFKGASTRRIKSPLFQMDDSISSSFEEISEEELNILKRFNPNKSIWQRNYHDTIIRDAQHLGNTINYIKNNPSKWRK